MTPKKITRSGQDDLFRTRLEDIINPHHALVRLADLMDWGFFEEAIEPLYSKIGRCGVPVRFMAGLHILKHVYGLSDEAVCERWVESPYLQYFTGEEYFVHELSYDRSNMSNWRKRVSEDELACLIQDSLRIACEKGALDQRDLKRVTVDTTVQPKAITFPTDTKLMYKTVQPPNLVPRVKSDIFLLHWAISRMERSRMRVIAQCSLRSWWSIPK